MMKKLFVLLLSCVILFSCAFAENEEENIEPGEGTIEFLVQTEDSAESYTEIEGFAPDNVERTILGRDNRITISNTNQYPFSAIAYMEIWMKCGCQIAGTGFMVDRDKLLTAAHCLICQTHNKWAYGITFHFGHRKGKKDFYTYNNTWNAYCGTNFANGYVSDNDWAVVKLYKNVGDRTGWFGTRSLSDQQVENGYYYISGYKDRILKMDVGKLHIKDSNEMWMDMDALPGNSGSPIYDSNNYAVGIWTTYYSNANSAVRLTSSILDYIRQYKGK